MANPRLYGAPPYRIAVVHGGPGAAGEAAPVARELAERGYGVVEPLQTAVTVEGQITELFSLLEAVCEPPITLIGHSWGAWLACLAAARRPDIAGKLILVGSGPFEERWAADIAHTRMRRLTADERAEFEAVARMLDNSPAHDRNTALARLGVLCRKADAFDPDDSADTIASDLVTPDAAVFDGVWREAAGMRRSGALLDAVRRVTCPVAVLHGDHDPHPPEGVEIPLRRVARDFRFFLLDRCGHTPWIERQARKRFFAVLEEELGERAKKCTHG
jgi:pimeloyl-ACP methyl ester carboxylesterase